MAVITALVLTRHGEARCNVAGLAGGENTCTGLTSLGRQQAGLLAARLRDEHENGMPFDVLYCSPRQRVQETADIVARALGLPVQTEPGLSGPEHGAADGQPWQDIKKAFGGPPQSDPGRPYAAGSESWNQYLARAGTTLGTLISRHRGHRILVTGHGETIEAAATLLLGLPPGTCTRSGFETGHASITRWNLHRNRFGQEVWILSALNDTGHLTASSTRQ